jgi:hypothetical protein
MMLIVALQIDLRLLENTPTHGDPTKIILGD